MDDIANLCKLKGISVRQLEKELGFGNGSIAKSKSIKMDRLQKIAVYFEIPIEYFTKEKALLYKVAEQTVELQELTDKFNRLDDADKQTILLMMDSMLKNDKYKKHSASEVG